MNFKKISLLLTLAALALAGCTAKKGGGGKGKTTGGGKTTPMELTEEQQAIYEQHYQNKQDCFGEDVSYDLVNPVGSTLQKTIHNYLIDQHKTYVLYTSIAAGIMNKVDQHPNGGIELFYTGKIVSNYKSGSVAGTQNREHVWPCADSGISDNASLWYRNSSIWEWKIDTNSKYWGGGSDLYHIRPADAEVNTTRSNAKFYQFVDGDGLSRNEKGESGGKYNIIVDDFDNPKRVEVADEFKGDVARLIAYLYIHYNKMGHDVYYSADAKPKPVYDINQAVKSGTGSDGKNHDPNVCGRLSLTYIFNYKTEAECAAVLKEWNRIDEPSEVEKLRNDTVQNEYQGNRNPFVDFPQLIDRCF